MKWFSPLFIEHILQLTSGIPCLITFTINYLATHSPEKEVDWEENFVSFMLDPAKNPLQYQNITSCNPIY